MTKEDNKYSKNIMEALEKIEDLKIKGKHKESIKEAHKVLIDDPNCVPALEEIADNYVSLNDFNSAKKAANRALNLDKNSYTAHYILGFLNSQNQNWDLAIKHLQTSNSLHPNSPEILRCLGWAIFNSKSRAQGVVILERSLNLDPENSLTLCDLGVCNLQIKEFNKSIELLKKALEIDPENNRIKECYLAAKQFSLDYKNINKVIENKKNPERKSFIN